MSPPVARSSRTSWATPRPSSRDASRSSWRPDGLQTPAEAEIRYVIVGAGAVGGALAARLTQHAASPCILIAREPTARLLRTSGLTLRSPDDEIHVSPIVVDSPHAVQLRTDDVLVFATKANQIEEALLQWADHPVRDAHGALLGSAGELLSAVTALNGVEGERRALRYFDRVYATTVWMPAVRLAPGEVAIRIAPVSGTFIMGRYAAAGTGADQAFLQALTIDWAAATFAVNAVKDPLRWKYSKLIQNLGNAVEALIGHDPAGSAITTAVTEEGRAVLAHAGIDTARPEEEAFWHSSDSRIRAVHGVPDEVGGSSWQSLARGTGEIETDFLNGEIVLIARTTGSEARLNGTLQRLARQAAAERWPPAALTPAELADKLGRRTVR